MTPGRTLNAIRSGARRGRAGFTLIEMLTVVALLIIVLGLMVSLATDVRQQSSDRLTKDLLRKLDVLMSQYVERHKRLPQVVPFVDGAKPAPQTQPTDAAVITAAGRHRAERRADAGAVKAAGREAAAGPNPKPKSPAEVRGPIPLRAEDELPDEATLLAAAEANNKEFVTALKNESTAPQPELFGSVGGTMYDEVTLRDAWGTPIVFMPGQHPAIGMALGNRPFFLSAGPDRKFRTLEDNLYSYEQGTSANRDGPRGAE